MWPVSVPSPNTFTSVSKRSSSSIAMKCKQSSSFLPHAARINCPFVRIGLVCTSCCAETPALVQRAPSAKELNRTNVLLCQKVQSLCAVELKGFTTQTSKRTMVCLCKGGFTTVCCCATTASALCAFVQKPLPVGEHTTAQ